MTQRLSGLMAVVVLVATAVIGLSAPAAHAAYCAGSGVGVVVDFGELGGGVSTGCGSGTKAAAAFDSAGVSLSADPQNPGFVCRVQGKPDAGDECMQTNAYWALFVSRQGGAWSYASQGVYTQTVASGDSVAFVWQSSNGRTTPGTAPQPMMSKPGAPTSAAPPAATKKPAAKPAAKPTKKPRATVSASTSTSAGASATPSDATTGMPTASASSATPTQPAVDTPTSATPTDTVTPDAEATDLAASTVASHDSDGGLPSWVGPAVIVLIIALAGGVTLWRKRQS